MKGKHVLALVLLLVGAVAVMHLLARHDARSNPRPRHH